MTITFFRCMPLDLLTFFVLADSRCRAATVQDATRNLTERADLLGARMFGRWKSVRRFNLFIPMWNGSLLKTLGDATRPRPQSRYSRYWLRFAAQ